MATRLRIPKTLSAKLQDLDDHLFLLRQSLYGLHEDLANLKTLSAELRMLVCLSHRNNEGLLWRLVDEVQVSDLILLHAFDGIRRDHPLNCGLAFAKVPMFRPGEGPPDLPPAELCTLRDLIKTTEAVFVSSVSDIQITHEELIKAIANQMGSAHEDDGISPELAKLRQILVNELASYVPILVLDAEFALQVGERVLDQAEATHNYKRKSRSSEYGNVTLAVRFAFRDFLAGRIPACTFSSSISEVVVTCVIGPQSVVWIAKKRDRIACELVSPYPADWNMHTDAVFAFSYSSSARQARVITNSQADVTLAACGLGLLNAREIRKPVVHDNIHGFVSLRFALAYARLLSNDDCRRLASISPDLSDLDRMEQFRGIGRVFPH